MNDSRLWIGTILLLSLGFAEAADGPQEWLDRMALAAQQMSYQATVVHTCDGVTDTVQIVHRIENGRVTERITSQDEAGREIIRNPEQVMCVLPEQKSVVVEPRYENSPADSSRISSMPSFSNIDTTTYKLSMHQPERVAGQDTEVIAVRPVDEYRYGYRLWLDRNRAMMLKFELLGEMGDTLEQIVITRIEYSDQISAGDVGPSMPMDTFTRQESTLAVKPTAEIDGTGNGLVMWRATELPAGFKLTARRSKSVTGSTQETEQLVYSDGLGSVSVFIETGVAEAEFAEGLSRFGATHAYTTTMENRLITAVGYVPVRTVKMIALSVRPVLEMH